jgi:hypothetical protein
MAPKEPITLYYSRLIPGTKKVNAGQIKETSDINEDINF